MPWISHWIFYGVLYLIIIYRRSMPCIQSKEGRALKACKCEHFNLGMATRPKISLQKRRLLFFNMFHTYCLVDSMNILWLVHHIALILNWAILLFLGRILCAGTLGHAKAHWCTCPCPSICPSMTYSKIWPASSKTYVLQVFGDWGITVHDGVTTKCIHLRN